MASDTAVRQYACSPDQGTTLAPLTHLMMFLRFFSSSFSPISLQMYIKNNLSIFIIIYSLQVMTYKVLLFSN